MSLIRKHGAVLQAWACLALVLATSGELDVMNDKLLLRSCPQIEPN